MFNYNYTVPTVRSFGLTRLLVIIATVLPYCTAQRWCQAKAWERVTSKIGC